jgi:hypothetical protein
VQRIVRAYDTARPRQQELPLSIGDAIEGAAQPMQEPAQPQVAPPAKPQ